MKAHFIQAHTILKEMIAEIAAKAEQAVQSAVDAVDKNNVAAATRVIANDAKIDEAEIKIEEECLKILALHQPVASDLRQVITILKVNNEIERVGDLAVNIAERVADMALYQERKIEKFDFRDMVNKAKAMLKQALDAMTYHDVAIAMEVIRSDDEVDIIHRNNYGKTRDMILRYPDEAQYYMDCLTVSRCLERIADSATNICEDVIYQENGHIVRHQHSVKSDASQ